MADGLSTSSSSSDSFHLLKEVKSHEVAIAELNSLPSSRASFRLAFLVQETVYQKNANIFFRTTIQKATALEQKHLEAAKRKLDSLNAS